ncbi:uncharacterized protein si:dkey-10o6.2 isoform X3 [Heterodontus francisci]|uniref:uncharacterized protein si:dkey-10o6.2 isoform X3 n=1 Tax=Heterodontus francisci TaxID=7792 RepID=UPI00355C3A25
MSIAVVDFGSFGLGKAEPSAIEMERLSTEIIKAFSDLGFVYLKNTGIEDQNVFKVMDISRNFFRLPRDIKQQYARSVESETPGHGWIEVERIISTNPGDLKEVFNLSTLYSSDKWPVKHDPEFTKCMESFFKSCEQLSIRIMKLIALGLGLESDFFVNKHKKIGSNKNPTTLRTAYYPAIQKSTVVEHQMRCGEHSDYGTFTLLFQDKNAGLEKHRVPIPQSDDMLNSPRQSVAFFVHPDHDATLVCCDGLDKYPPIKAIQYLKENLSDVFQRESYPTDD